jgi:hypothetical protein
MKTYRIVPGGETPDSGFYIVAGPLDDLGTAGCKQFKTREEAETEIERLRQTEAPEAP